MHFFPFSFSDTSMKILKFLEVLLPNISIASSSSSLCCFLCMFSVNQMQLDVGSAERLDERKRVMPLKRVTHLVFSFKGNILFLNPFPLKKLKIAP